MTLLQPLAAFDAVDMADANACLVRWEHKMGPLHRPNFGRGRCYGLRLHGDIVAIAAHDQMIAEETCGLTRAEAIELTRICADRTTLCRVVLRLWRECVFPAACDAWGCSWAISYQDNHLHTGNLYRLDGWVRIGRTRSGTDKRATGGDRKGRNKTVWGWTRAPGVRSAARAAIAIAAVARATRSLPS